MASFMSCVTSATLAGSSGESMPALQQVTFRLLPVAMLSGGAAALAAALSGKVPVDADTVIMVTGGNTDAASFAKTLIA